MESLFAQFYATAEPWFPVFGWPSWAYHIEAQVKREKKKPFFLSCVPALLEYGYFYI